MCITYLVLALLGLYVGMAHSWDIAVSVGDRLEFYTNGTKTDTVHFESHNLTAITYDEVHNMMLFVDKQSDNDAICGYNLGAMNTRCFIKRSGSDIQDLAYDPATELLFFIDTKEGTINWISLKDQGSEEYVHGNLLIKSQAVQNIAVDSCRGYIYWINNHKYINHDIMERARFNGSEREVVYKYLPIYSFDIDPKTHEYYYIDGVKWDDPFSSFYEKADLRKTNLKAEMSKVIYYRKDNASYFTLPKELTVSKDYIYWMNSSMSYTTVWQRPKNAQLHEEPRDIIRFYSEKPMGIAANYRITEQVQGLEDCEALSSLIPRVTVIDNSPKNEQNKQKQQTTETYHKTEAEQTTEFKLTCVHGIKVSQTSVCKCIPGYTGERCDVPACENYCLQGNCTYNDEGVPQCRCKGGYSGERCEFNACHGYCLNDGGCSLNEKNEPVCQCQGNYEGYRCHVSGCLNYCIHGSCSFNDEGHPVCSCNAGYLGERCEVSACHGYCLNNGECALNEEDEPVCECVGNHEGSRCETFKRETLSNDTQYYSKKQNLTLTDLLSNWRKPAAKLSVIVEVKSY